MELFECKRYLGEDSVNSSNQGVSLNDYLESVKQRKRKRLEDSCGNDQATSEPVCDESADGSSVVQKKKKQRDIKKTGDPLSNYLEEVTSRRKRREAKELGNSEVSDTFADGLLDELKPKKKEQKQSGALLRQKECENRSNILGEEAFNISSTSKSFEENSFNADPTEISVKVKTNKSSDVHNVDIDATSADFIHSKSLIDDTKPKKKLNKKKKKRKNKKTVTDEPCEDQIRNEDNPERETKTDEKVVSYEVLGEHSFQNKVKVKRVLPRWLAEPTVISADLFSGSSIKDVGKLHFLFLQNLESMGIKELFPVQLAVIPNQLKCLSKVHYLWPRDLCVSAPTGSGKTLAYALPILQAHYELPKSSFYALVVVPVQELALQVTKVFLDVAKGTGIKIECVTGGRVLAAEAKRLVLKREDNSYANLVNVLIATPGRLMEHFFLTPGFSVKNLKFIVIDEADRIVEQKSLNWLHLIEKQCNPSFTGVLPPVTFYNLSTQSRGPQKLLFSATLSQDPEKLLKFNLFQPKLITSVVKNKTYGEDKKDQFYGKFTTPASLKENYIICDIDKKPLLTHKLLVDGWRRVLIFTKSCIEANRLFQLLSFLNPTVKIEELTSLMVLSKRQLVVNNFGRGLVEVLVCSDRLARGIDIKGVDYVIIYDPPKHAKGYIHKAGRTGRAGMPGTALSILTQKQSQGFFDMLNKAGKSDLERIQFEQSDLDQYQQAFTEAFTFLKASINEKKTSFLNHIIKEKRTKTTFNNKKRKRVI